MSFWANGFWEGVATGGVIVNDGIAVEISTMQIILETQDAPFTVELADTAAVLEVATEVIEVEICE